MPKQPPTEYRYWAFISYSSRDKSWARWLHRAIETYGIPAQLIQRLAGRNTVWSNLAGVLFGVIMYFPTLVEVPIAQTFLSLGMQRGPLLAYLLADPELSVQSILITGSVIGKKKTAVYVVLVTIFSTLSGLIFGWIVG